MNRKFWQDKKVLVTGYEGFLGSNLTRALLGVGAKVIGLDIRVRRRDTILSKSDYKKIRIIRGDVSSYQQVKNVIEQYQPEVIFHLAAETIVGKCLENPRRTFTSNIKGTWELLEVCRHFPMVKGIVIASSDKAYGSHKELPYKENTPLSGNHTYDVSKSCADLIAYTYFHTYGVPVVIIRCGNIYGPGDFNFSRIVPDTIRCAILDKPILIRSDGKFTRDYVFVDDIINGYIMLAEQLQKLNLGGEAFNFSNETPITVIDLVKKIYEMMGKKPNYKILNQAKYEIKHQYLSSQKARKILGWKPRYSLEEGLKITIDWYKNYFKKNENYLLRD